MHSLRRLLLALMMILAIAPAAAHADRQSVKKSIWGPTKVGAKSAFPLYKKLGVGLFQMTVRWPDVAPRRPAEARNPADSAYRWPREVGYAVRQGRRHGIKVMILLTDAPRWANGGKSRVWAPKRATDFANFAAAAARRWRRVDHWMIWGEPSRRANFRPLPKYSSQGPRRYARILDAAYGSIKRVARRDRVIGGNTFTTGDVSPKQWIRGMRLRNGRRPRMDLYGHNPFTLRTPDLRKPPLGYGFADFSDLDTLAKWLDRYGYRKKGKRMRLFLSEFTAPSDHPNYEFNFYVTREVQAKWIRRALRITRRWNRIYTFGWLSLYDEEPNGGGGRHGDEVHRGLLTSDGREKPSYFAYKRG